VESVLGVLEKRGYSKEFSGDFDKVYGGSMERHSKGLDSGPATIDLLVGSLQTRQTGAVWSYELIYGNSEPAVIVCRLGKATARVAFKELLVAMKMHAARFTDARDVGMLCNSGVDVNKIKDFLYRGDEKILEENIKKILGYVSDKRYVEGLKSVYGLGGRFDSEGLSKKTGRVLREILEGI
jgi:hypothetical protein